MEATGEGLWDWQVPSGLIVHNVAWPLMLGLDESSLTHQVDDFINLIHPQDLPAVQQVIQRCLAEGSDYVSEHRLRFKDSHYIWVLDRGKVVERSTDGRPLRMVGSMKNIDERKRSEAEIHQLAFYDELTLLPNRRLLIERLQLTITKKRRSQALGALMFLDMDRFKLLNDTHGHAMGDALLIQVAARLQACLRAGDTVARLGGDEFVVLLDELTAEPDVALQKAQDVANKILGALNQPYQLGTLSYPSTPSIGVTLFSGLDVTMDDVLKRADSAMYAAKAAGRNTIRVFDAAA
jgi:diguanylate cyclase (GGDEF)-like protein/PAS domain S-box-containing protein